MQRFFIEISQLFTGRATDIDDIITNNIGTLIGYFTVRFVTENFTKRTLSDSKINDFYLICSSVGVIMFFLQPFVSTWLWGNTFTINPDISFNKEELISG